MTLTTPDLIAIVVALAALVLSIVAFMRQHPDATPAALDAEVTRRLAELQADRPAIDRMETAYLTAGDLQRHALDTLAGALTTLAPLTPMTTDDELRKLLEDIRQRGAPTAAPTLPTPHG